MVRCKQPSLPLSYVFNQAGNVVTGEMVEQLILSGADIVKVGIGPGICQNVLQYTFNYTVYANAFVTHA